MSPRYEGKPTIGVSSQRLVYVSEGDLTTTYTGFSSRFG